MIPLPHQIVGAQFLSDRPRALLADAPRVGKTGAAIMACDDLYAGRVLVVTTASGRPVWERAWRDWSMFDLPIETVYNSTPKLVADRVIVSWGSIAKLAPLLAKRYWDVLILDESHYAKAWDAQRTQAVYGLPGATEALVDHAANVWCLTGSPMANGPHDLHPMLVKLAPERLQARPKQGWPDVTDLADYMKRYCIVRPKRLSRWTTIDIVVGSRNLEELRDRLSGKYSWLEAGLDKTFWLRRTQKDVGITEPIYEVLPLHISAAERKRIEAEVPEAADILDAADTLETRELDMSLSKLRRLTGGIKARGVVQVVKDEFAGGLDKIVLMAWHTSVLDHLEQELKLYGVVRIDGSTSPANRVKATTEFAKKAKPRVFLGQIIACGESIDLSPAADLIFVEYSFAPKDLAQAALRITNLNQQRQPRIRTAALEGSIDEAFATVLTRKVKDIREVLT